MPLCCIQTLGIYCGCWANQMVVRFGRDQSYDHMRLHKKFHQQWIKENGTPFTKLQSAPTDKRIFLEEKFTWAIKCFWRILQDITTRSWRNYLGIYGAT